jgi:hypothetical protein
MEGGMPPELGHVVPRPAPGGDTRAGQRAQQLEQVVAVDVREPLDRFVGEEREIPLQRAGTRDLEVDEAHALGRGEEVAVVRLAMQWLLVERAAVELPVSDS